MQEKFSEFLADLFRPGEKVAHPKWIIAWCIGIYLVGLAAWGHYFGWGNFPDNFADWAGIAVPRLLFLKDAIIHGVLPLHISNANPLGGVTDRYLAVPNTLFSPQVFLLTFMDIGHFILTDTFLFFTIGFSGLLWLRRRLSLSVVAFSVLFLLFNFNGHIVAHFSVGHTSWEAYFLYPWFAALVVSLLGGNRSWRWVAGVSVLMFVAFLQGAFHQVLWMSLFLGLVALPNWRNLLAVAKAGVFIVLLNSLRLVPTIQIFTQLKKNYDFMSGYPSVTSVWQALVHIQNASTYITPPQVYFQTGYWEFDLYVGYLGVLFLGIFGIFMWIRHPGVVRRYLPLILPIIVMAVISFNKVYKIIHDSPIPLFNGERAASRMLILPFLFLVLIAVIQLQRWLERTQLFTLGRVAVVELVIVEAFELWQNFQAWTVAQSASAFQAFQTVPSAWTAVTRSDPAYMRALDVGMMGTLFGAIVLLGLVWWENRRRATLVVVRVEPKPSLSRTWHWSNPTFHLGHVAKEVKYLKLNELQPVYVKESWQSSKQTGRFPK